MSDVGLIAAAESYLDRVLPLSWKQIAGIAVALLALMAAVVTLDGIWPSFWSEGLWSRLLVAPTVIVYILCVGKVIQPFQQRAVQSLRSISALDEGDYQQMVLETELKSRKGSWVALAAGFAFGFLASMPGAVETAFSWVNWYFPLMNGLMFGLLALVVQQSLAESQLSSRLLQGPLEFDIFYTTPFLPIGMASLVNALAFVGGSTIAIFYSALGRNAFTWTEIIIHLLLVVVTLLVFFLPMRQAHKVLRAAKVSEQNNIRRELAEAYRRLEALTLEQKQNILPFSQEVNLWTQYEARLKEVPTWPYNAGMLRTLFASILIPILVTVGQRVMAFVLVELGIK